MITPIPSYYATVIWPRVSGHVMRALDYADSGFGESDIVAKLAVSDMQLWVVNDYQAACVTQICVYPKHKVCLVVALGGDGVFDWFDELMDAIEEWARQLGCKYVEECGRRGWQKVARHRGYEHVYSVTRKALWETKAQEIPTPPPPKKQSLGSPNSPI